jgi:hypothetical protein
LQFADGGIFGFLRVGDQVFGAGTGALSPWDYGHGTGREELPRFSRQQLFKLFPGAAKKPVDRLDPFAELLADLLVGPVVPIAQANRLARRLIERVDGCRDRLVPFRAFGQLVGRRVAATLGSLARLVGV